MIDQINALKDAGQVSYFVVLGVLGVVSTMYIKSLIQKLESLPNMNVLLKKVDDLVYRVQIICNNQELSKQSAEIKIESIEKRLRHLEEKFCGKQH